MFPSRARARIGSLILIVVIAGFLFSPSACGDRTGTPHPAPAREGGDDVPSPDPVERKARQGDDIEPPGDGSEPESIEFLSCPVVRIVDGDTIKVEIDGKMESVRYIGIDTPETVHPNRPIQPFGKAASKFNEDLLASGEVQLSFDLERRDHYGRLLAYVYTVHDNRRVLVNLELVRAGLARAFPYPPNVSYAELFREAESEAREAHRGIWGDGE